MAVNRWTCGGRRVGVVGVIVATLLAASCGGEDSVATTTSTTTSTTTTTAVPGAGGPVVTQTSVATATTVEAIDPGAGTATTAVAGSDPAATTLPAATEPAPTTVAPVDTGIVLAPDGLGIVSFDEPAEDVIAEMTALLGPADSTSEYFEPAIGVISSAGWSNLRLTFTGNSSLFFHSYDFSQMLDVAYDDATGVSTFALRPWEPAAWEAGLATPEGVQIGWSAADAAAVYPEVHAPQCTGPMRATTLVAGDGTVDSLFLVPQQVGLNLKRPIDGRVWSIAAQVAPNPLICDGI